MRGLWLVSVVIGVGVLGGSYVLGEQKGDREKKSGYECGFEAYDEGRGKLEVRFYIIGIVFMVFDVEASYVMPWVSSVEYVGGSGSIGMLDFMLELVIGYVYIWRRGSIDE